MREITAGFGWHGALWVINLIGINVGLQCVCTCISPRHVPDGVVVVLFACRLKAEIEKLRLEYEESATQEQQKHSSEVKVSSEKSCMYITIPAIHHSKKDHDWYIYP